MNYSLVMAVKNGDEFINQAINSVLEQKVPPQEIIVIDDHSHIPLNETIKGEANILILNAISNGQMAALNQGLSKVQTEYVAFLDHDDLWPKLRQNRHFEIFSKYEADVAVSRVINFEGQEPNKNIEMQDMGISRVLGACTIKMDVFNKVGEFDEGLNHHGIIEWWDRADKKGIKLQLDNYPGLYRRIHENNSGIKSKTEARKSLFEILRRLN